MSKCLKCGAPLEQLPNKRKKKYCNSTCRSGNWHKRARKNKAKESGGLPLPKDIKTTKKISAVDKNGKVVIKDITKPKTSELKVSPQTNYSIDTRPKSLKELKELCPKELSGLDRSQWIAQARKKFNV